MWIRATTKLSDHITQVTTPLSSHFLVAAETAAVTDAGIIGTASRLVDDIKANLAPECELRYLLITHAHFDHIGGIPELRAAFPKIEVIASPLAAELVESENYLRSVFDANVESSAALQSSAETTFGQWREGFRIDRVMGDGDTIQLGDGVDVKAVACAGHSDDSFVYYIHSDTALYAGEAVGAFHGRGKFSASFTTSKKSYIASIQKLHKLELRIIGFSHTGALSGMLAQTYLDSAVQTADTFATTIRTHLEEGLTKEEVANILYPELLEAKTPPDGALTLANRACVLGMVQAVAAES